MLLCLANEANVANKSLIADARNTSRGTLIWPIKSQSAEHVNSIF